MPNFASVSESNSTIMISYQYLGCYGDNVKVKAMTKKIGTVTSVMACYNLAVINGYALYGLQYGGECWVSNNMTKSVMYGLCGQCKSCSNQACNCAKKKCLNGDNCGDGYANALYMVTSSDQSPPSSTPTVIPSTISSFEPTVDPSYRPSLIPSSEPTDLLSYSPSFTTTNIDKYRYLGCYGDNVKTRAMTKNIGIVNSALGCYNLALSKGYSIYGLQNGGECWVSNNLTKSEMYGQCGKCTKCSRPNCNCSNKKCANGDKCGDAFANDLFLIPTTVEFLAPSESPTLQTLLPTGIPTFAPSIVPTSKSTYVHTSELTIPTNMSPTVRPTKKPATHKPTKKPATHRPTTKPVTHRPTKKPSRKPSPKLTTPPIKTSGAPSKIQIKLPTNKPIKNPTKKPIKSPTKKPSKNSIKIPTKKPVTIQMKKPVNFNLFLR